jgi:hypothetical protein
MASTNKPALPSIDDELTAPRKRLDLKAIQPMPAADDEAIEENSRKLGSQWGASTSLGKPAEAGPARAPVVSMRIEGPDYLDEELRIRAAKEGVTKAYLVLKALKDAGYRIEDADLVPDKRKARQRKS